MLISPEVLARVVADWWVKQPSLDIFIEKTNVLASFFDRSSFTEVTEFQQQLFHRHLLDAVRIRLETTYARPVSVGCDYHPDVLLRDCLALSGIPDLYLPEKTKLLIWNDKIEAWPQRKQIFP